MERFVMTSYRPRLVAVSGSANRPSRSRALAQAIATATAERLNVSIEIFDLIDAGPGLGAAFTRKELSEQARHVVEAVENADALIAVSPAIRVPTPACSSICSIS